MKSDNLCYYSICRMLLVLAACCSGVCCHTSETKNANPVSTKRAAAKDAININTASVEELKKIPHIGEKIAEGIVAHRTIHGPFRKVEHLMLVDGISDQRFRRIREFVRIE